VQINGAAGASGALTNQRRGGDRNRAVTIRNGGNASLVIQSGGGFSPRDQCFVATQIMVGSASAAAGVAHCRQQVLNGTN